MKIDWRVLPFAAILLATNADLRALSAAGQAGADPTAGTPVRSELRKLVRADAKKIEELNKAAATTTVVNRPGIITMSPFIVTDRKMPDVALPKYEAPFMRYLRNGTMLYLPGKTITTKVSTGFSLIHGFTKTKFELNFFW